MKYENKQKVDELCRKIKDKEEVLEGVKNSTYLQILTAYGYAMILDIRNEDEDHLQDEAHKAARTFKFSISCILSQEINELKKELEKL